MGRGSRANTTASSMTLAAGPRQASRARQTPASRPQGLQLKLHQRVANAYNMYTDHETGMRLLCHTVRPTDFGDGHSHETDIINAEGKRVGMLLTTTITDAEHDLKVLELAELKLDDSVQGQGFATRLMGYLQERFRRAGIARIELQAADRGAYAWSKMGFRFSGISGLPDPYEEAEMAYLVRTSAEPHLRRLAAEGKVSSEDVQALLKQLPTSEDLDSGDYWQRLTTPEQIGAYGREQTFTGADGKPTWLGRECLLASSWNGVKWLSEPPQASAGDGYEALLAELDL